MGLLVYLSCNLGRPFPRDTLASLLWGSSSVSAARGSLRQALYVLRKALPDGAIRSEGENVTLVHGVDLDVDRFQDAVASDDWSTAIDLYRGDFLGDLHLPGAEDFLRWAEGRRVALRELYRSGVLAEVERASSVGDWGTALNLVGKLMGPDTLEVEAQLVRAELLSKAGRGPEAMAAATHLEAQYRETFEADPPPAFSERIAAVLSSDGTTDIDKSDADPPPRRTPAFSGRGEEVASLFRAWHRAREGEGIVVLVEGDPGIGKTRLMEEVIRPAEFDGATILRGKSYELEQGLLYEALVEVMRQAIGAPGFPGVSDVWLSELTRLLPELKERYRHLETNGEAETDAGRRRFYEAVAQVFEALAYEAPVICVLDDLHWADEATLEMLHYLSRRLCAVPVLLLAGLRPGQSSETLRRLQRVLVEEHGGLEIQLGPLQKADIRSLLSSSVGDRQPPRQVLDLVWEASEGNPFFALSAVEALEDAGALETGEAGWVFHQQAENPISRMPPKAKELIDGWLAGLSPAETQILEIGAVAGRTFTPGVVQEILSQPGEDIGTLLGRLERRRIVSARIRDDHTVWDFRHDRLREAVYNGIPIERRAELHGLVAGASRTATGPEAASLARHYARAGNRDLAYQNALAAADWARSVFANSGEQEMLRLAADSAPTPDAKRAVSARLEFLPTGGSEGRGGRRASLSPDGEASPVRTRRRGKGTALLAAAVVTVALAVTWPAWGPRLIGGTSEPLPPLPQGLLLQVTSVDWEGLAIMDPDSAERPFHRLTPDQISAPTDIDPASALLLSPDGQKIAFPWTKPGVASDVFTSRRDGSGPQQLTTNPSDDGPLGWLPDGSGVLLKSLKGDPNAGYTYEVAVGREGGGPPTVILSSERTISLAVLSPDGTQIAFVESTDYHSIWLTDFHGNGKRLVQDSLFRSGPMAWHPDGSRLAYFVGGPTDSQLVITDVENGDSRPLTDQTFSPDGELVWSSAGDRVYFSALADGSLELFSAQLDGSPVDRLNHSGASERLVGVSGPPPPFISEVEILVGAKDTLIGLPGRPDTLPVVIRDSEGRVVEGISVRWNCLDTNVCDVDENGVLIPGFQGSTQVVADVRGWRADTLAFSVVETSPRQLLGEDWESGLDPEVWHTFGEPSPVVLDELGFRGSRGFQSNGDDSEESGVVSRASFPLGRGLTVELWGRGEFDPTWPSWQYLQVGVTQSPPEEFNGNGPHPLRPLLFQISGEGRDSPTFLSFGPFRIRESEYWDPKAWHCYAIQVLPSGETELWVDGHQLLQNPSQLPVRDSVRLVLEGRASHGPVIHDEVLVWGGLKYQPGRTGGGCVGPSG